MALLVVALFAGRFKIALASTISNIQPRRDTSGQLMDIHDGNIVKWRGQYYYSGMGYGPFLEGTTGCSNQTNTSAGFRDDHRLAVYSSPDLVHWTLVTKNALPVNSRPRGIYYRPKVIIRPGNNTNSFVLWINYMDPIPRGPDYLGHYLTAEANDPAGPYHVRDPDVRMTEQQGIYCDFDIHLVRDTAYMVYTVWKSHGEPIQNTHIKVEQLSADFLGSSGKTSPIFLPFPHQLHPGGADEAPAMFQRKGIYYILFGHGCCFCAGGSGVNVFTSTHPLGPYSSANASYDIGCQTKPGQAPDIGKCESVAKAQQNSVFPVATTGGVEFVWTGDRWQSAKDRLKAHDLQFWTTLDFDDSVQPARIKHLRWVDSIDLELV